jgi:hypothetical protein
VTSLLRCTLMGAQRNCAVTVVVGGRGCHRYVSGLWGPAMGALEVLPGRVLPPCHEERPGVALRSSMPSIAEAAVLRLPVRGPGFNRLPTTTKAVELHRWRVLELPTTTVSVSGSLEKMKAGLVVRSWSWRITL